MASRTLKVEIIGDASSFQRALGNATKTSSGLSRAFKGLGIAAAGAGVAIGAGFVYTLKRGFDELAEAQKVAAQTSAVIKSTGAAANVSKKQVEEYAEALSEMSGVDDEVIASGENMLLTFKNIRNEQGKGNDIFRQATGTLLDMSTALGTDMNKSAIQLGKALNDPIKGITALQRVGVSFTAGQKATIAGMVEAGNVMGAQKLILAELNSEFGGSAKAFGDTMPGQLAKLRNAFDEVSANLAVKFLPVLMGLVQWINTNWGTISAVFDAVGTAITASFQGIGVAVNYLRQQWEIHRESAIAAWNAVRDGVQRFVAFFRSSVLPAIQNVISAAMAIWNNFGGEIKTVLGAIITFWKTWMQNMIAPLKIFLAVLRGDWSEAWNELKGVVTRTLGAALSIFKGMVGSFISAAAQIGKGIITGILGALSGLAAKVGAQMQKVWDNLKTAAATAYGFGAAIGAALMRGIADAALALVNWLKGVIEKALGFLKNLNPFSTVREGGAKYIGKPLMEGAADEVKKQAPALEAVTVAAVRKAVGAAGLEAAKVEIGGPAVQKIINDIVGKTPSLKAQFATAVREAAAAAKAEAVARAQEIAAALTSAKAAWASAFAGLYQAGIDAIAAKYAGWQPPSLIKAQEEAEARAARELLATVAEAATKAQEAMNAVVAANKAQTELVRTPEMTDEQWAKAQADAVAATVAANDALIAANKTYDDALFTQRQAALAALAKQEEIDHAKKIKDEQTRFEKMLGVIQGQYAGHKITYEQMMVKIRKLLASFDIDFVNAGKAWGNALAEGIRSAVKEVDAAAKELAKAAKDNTQNNSPKPKEGPLSKKSMYDAGREHGMNWAKGIASAAGAVGKAAATTAGGASGGFGDAKNTGNIFDFGSGTPPPGGFGPDFEGARPGWADRELWETTAVMAAKLGKFDALIDAVQSGSIKANAGLLSQLFYARTRQTWNDFPARIAKILDDMRGPEGLSSAEAAAKYGLKQGGYTKRDGFAFLHKNEIVTPLPSGGRASMMGSQAININFNGTVMGGTEAQMARVLAPAIENEIRRSQRRGNASIVQAT